MEVIKRNNSVEKFSKAKIRKSMMKAFRSCKQKFNQDSYNSVLEKILDECGDKKSNCKIHIERIQDIIEESLVKCDLPEVAKEYILYRHERERIREFVRQKSNFIEGYKKAFNTADNTIDDNSNVGNKNIGVLNAEIHKPDNVQINRMTVTNKLGEMYDDFDPKQYCRDLEEHLIYKNDESSFACISPYCVAITMYPFLLNGMKELGGLSARPKNLDSYCGMLVNLIFALSSQFAGAVALPEALLCFDYFARKEFGDDYNLNANSFYKIGYKFRKLLNESHYWANDMNELASHDFGNSELNKLRDELVFESVRPLTEDELKEWYENIKENPEYTLKLGDGTRTILGQIHQCFQQIIYSINQPASARGMQSAFVNFSYFDELFFHGMFDDFIFPDGSRPIWGTLNWLQKNFMMWFNAERQKCILTFPVESFAMIYQNGEFSDKDNYQFVCDEYARGHSFFTYISDTVDSLSSCCRLRNNLTTKEFNFTNGNLSVQTGSKSVITLNLSRIVQNAVKDFDNPKDRLEKENIYEAIKKYLVDVLERVYRYHNAYNQLLWDMYDARLMPAYDAGFINLDKQYLTIGLNGLNQAAEYVGLQCNKNDDYSEFCQLIFGTVKEQNALHKTKHTMFNTEQVPAESVAVKNYNWDKEDGYWVPEDTNLYASYVFKPNDSNISVLDKLELHGRDYIGDFLDGGAAAHINLEEHLSSKQYDMLLKHAANVGCQYLTFNIKMMQCNDCGHIVNHPVEKCPKCESENLTTWTRIIGYLTAVPKWSKGRREEFKTRIFNKESDIENV